LELHLQPPITDWFVLEDQAILPSSPFKPATTLENKTGRLSALNEAVYFLKVDEQLALDIISLSDVNPFVLVRDAVDTANRRRVSSNRHNCESMNHRILKWHFHLLQ
jgi:hypothetical protein